MAYLDFIQPVHQSTPRDYLSRVLAGNKAEFATIAKKFDREYWDGSRNTGYGGYTYDGRWKTVAERMAKHYELKSGSKVLDIGCGKGFLLKEFVDLIPGIEVSGIDISEYAINEAHPDVKKQVSVGTAEKLSLPDASIDLVLSINTLHNLRLPELEKALGEIERVARGEKYVVMDGYRNEQEKVNLMYWQLTCECFFTPKEWEWIFKKCGYTGDYSCIFFN